MKKKKQPTKKTILEQLLPSFFSKEFKDKKSIEQQAIAKMKESFAKKKKKLLEDEKVYTEKIKKAIIQSQTQDFLPKKMVSFLPNPLAWWEYKQTIKLIKKRLFIQMDLENGDVWHGYVVLDHGSFLWEGKRYIIKQKYYRYSSTAKAYCGHYHELFALPIAYNIPFDALRKVVREQQPEIQYTTDPKLLEKFTISKLIQMMLDDGNFEKLLQTIFYILIGVGIVGILTFMMTIIIIAKGVLS